MLNSLQVGDKRVSELSGMNRLRRACRRSVGRGLPVVKFQFLKLHLVKTRARWQHNDYDEKA